MEIWSEGYADADGVRFHYYRGGVGNKALVFAHGLSDNGLCWAPVAKRWLAHYDVYLPDARGHGLSARLTSGQVLEPGMDLERFLAALDLRQVGLGGHSMGASSAAEVAARCPDRVAALILEDPGWRDPARPPDTSRRDKLARFAGKDVDQIASARRTEHPTWNDAEILASAQALVQLDQHIVDTPIVFGEWVSLLPMIRCPALLLTADPDRASIVTAPMAARASQLCPSLGVVHIGGAGHSIRREQLAAYVDAVDSFLNRYYPPD